MHVLRSAALAATLGTLICAGPAIAAFDHTITITDGHLADGWTSTDGSGINPSNYTRNVPRSETEYRCSKDPNTYCDNALVHVTLSDVGAGLLTFRIEGFQQTSDYDLRVYGADETGAPQGAFERPVGDRSDDLETSWGDFETTTFDLGSRADGVGNVDAYYLVEIPYWMVVNDHYTFKVEASGLEPFESEDE